MVIVSRAVFEMKPAQVQLGTQRLLLRPRCEVFGQNDLIPAFLADRDGHVPDPALLIGNGEGKGLSGADRGEVILRGNGRFFELQDRIEGPEGGPRKSDCEAEDQQVHSVHDGLYSMIELESGALRKCPKRCPSYP